MPYVVRGYSEFMRAMQLADKQSRKALRDELRRTGERVRVDAGARFARYSARTAAGYRTRVRQRGIAVEQSLRRTTGLRGDFGALQMRRALLPARDDNLDTLERDLEAAMDRIADRFNAGG